MNKKLLVFLLLFLPFISISQDDTPKKKKDYKLGVKTSLNISNYKSDTLNFGYAVKTAFGVYVTIKRNERFALVPSLQYSLRGANSLNPNYKLENKFIDMGLLAQYKLNNMLYAQGGLTYGALVASNQIVNNGEKWSGVERLPISGYSSEINVPLGIKMKLTKNVDLGFNVVLPLKGRQKTGFNFTLGIDVFNRDNGDESYRKIRNRIAKQQINELNQGTLLVRLKTSENKIAALKEVGKYEEAELTRERQFNENQKIMKAFKQEYDFSKVVFFYSNKSRSAKNRDFNNIFLNDDLKIDPEICIDTTKAVFFAEFGTIEQDTARYFSHTSFDPIPNGKGRRKVDHYYKPSGDFDFDALIILDYNMIQLNSPFPYYERYFYQMLNLGENEGAFTEDQFWPQRKTVENMNYKLWRFLRKDAKDKFD